MKILIPFAALAALMPLVPATAETGTHSRTVVVGDLDLASAKDRATLDRRIHRAAAEVCGTASDLDLTGQNDARACRTRTADAAIAQAQTQLAARKGAVQVAAAR